MKIKRFFATSMRTALRMVREEQGPNAVILSSRSVARGVEIVSATDYDEGMIPDTTHLAANATSQDTSAGASSATLQAHELSLLSIRRELAEMRQMMEREARPVNSVDSTRSAQSIALKEVRAIALKELSAYGCCPKLASSIIHTIPADIDKRRLSGLLLEKFAGLIQTLTGEAVSEGGVIALIGPTGVGKTTTIAKLAARYACHHSPRDVALVTTDTYRIGGREQLHTYGRLLGMPVIEVPDRAALLPTLSRLADYPLVLIDTVGISQRDKTLTQQLTWMNTVGPIKNYLVLPANVQPHDLDEIVRRFGITRPSGTILTKLDETSRLGTVLSATARHQLPVAYITDGQRVPQDLHQLTTHQLVLRMADSCRNTVQPEEIHAAA